MSKGIENHTELKKIDFIEKTAERRGKADGCK